MDLQLRALHARDQTDAALPYLATSEPSYSRFSATEPDGGETSPDPRAHSGSKGARGLGTWRPPSLAENPSRRLVRLKLERTRGEPARVDIELHTLHIEWNAPCIATLKRFVRSPPPGAAAASLPGVASQPEGKQEIKWQILNRAGEEEPAASAAPTVRARINVMMTRLSLSLNQESLVDQRGSLLCVVTMKQLRLRAETCADGTLGMRGSIEELSARDLGRRREAATCEMPMLSIGVPGGAEPAMQFNYHKIFSATKRPPQAHIAYESELNLRLISLRVIWLQQWVVGAFECAARAHESLLRSHATHSVGSARASWHPTHHLALLSECHRVTPSPKYPPGIWTTRSSPPSCAASPTSPSSASGSPPTATSQSN